MPPVKLLHLGSRHILASLHVGRLVSPVHRPQLILAVIIVDALCIFFLALEVSPVGSEYLSAGKHLQTGPGVGGHCSAVDPWFIVAAAPEEAKLIRAAREVNDS
jgi:hypothetical protein